MINIFNGIALLKEEGLVGTTQQPGVLVCSIFSLQSQFNTVIQQS